MFLLSGMGGLADLQGIRDIPLVSRVHGFGEVIVIFMLVGTIP